MDPGVIVAATASFVLDELTDGELITLNLIGTQNNDPRQTMCWPKAKSLFTIIRADGVPVMHELTKDAVWSALGQRGLV